MISKGKHFNLKLYKSSYKDNGFIPTVTAVIPAYNEEKTIVATVRSVLAADYEKLDVIVVDDGSKDNTYKILKKEFQVAVRRLDSPYKCLGGWCVHKRFQTVSGEESARHSTE